MRLRDDGIHIVEESALPPSVKLESAHVRDEGNDQSHCHVGKKPRMKSSAADYREEKKGDDPSRNEISYESLSRAQTQIEMTAPVEDADAIKRTYGERQSREKHTCRKGG
jgi:hypothetical protein